MKTPEDKKYELGMIGLGTMGRNLLLNMADHGYRVCGYDKDPKTLELLENQGEKEQVKGFSDLKEFINSLKSPRAVMLLVPAGKIVDSVITELLPLLDKDDLIIDGGNSHFTDTNRRVQELKQKQIHFFGMGISGGEKGARTGPSMMPGGDKDAYAVVKPIFEAIAAKVNGETCVAYMGPGAAGHFVKMVHNGIEYAIMELIAETYQLMKKGLQLSDKEIGENFAQWNKGRMNSYLLEITCDILIFKEKGKDHILLNDIKDEAKAHGTGKWTSQVAMDLVLPIPTIDSAVSARDVSKYKSLREKLANQYPKEYDAFSKGDKKDMIEKLGNTLYFSTIISYAQGMHLLSKASTDFEYDLNLAEIAKIWRGGCIIRAEFLNDIYAAYQKKSDLQHLLLDEKVQSTIKETVGDARELLSQAIKTGIGSMALASSLSYFDSLGSAHVPANLIQAQRDYFGAHTYELNEKEGVFHNHWDA